MSNSSDNNDKPRKRSLTSITIGWIAERMRKTERIKEEIAKGSYKVESEKIAASLVNEKPGV